ncbi:MAG: C40 family peptidase [Gammaproteobacteria bacterium]
MAERMIGTPYRWGGADLEGFDCSGLVQFSYAQAKLRVPRTTSQQRKVARDISRQALRKGDLVFFDIEGKDNHVGVYLGDSRFVHAPSSGKRVQSASLQEPYYSERFAGAGRIPGADTPVD